MSNDSREIFLKDLVREVAKETEETQVAVEKVLRSVFKSMADHLVDGNKIYLIDFLNFETRFHAAKHVKHPQTGTPMTIQPYYTIAVHPTRALKKRLKG